MQNTEALAVILYEEHRKAVGGKAFNGDLLPTWAVFKADPLKQKQSDAWMAVAVKATYTVKCPAAKCLVSLTDAAPTTAVVDHVLKCALERCGPRDDLVILAREIVRLRAALQVKREIEQRLSNDCVAVAAELRKLLEDYDFSKVITRAMSEHLAPIDPLTHSPHQP
jgi:hypothetical protein